MSTIDFLKNNVITTGRVLDPSIKQNKTNSTQKSEKPFSEYLNEELKKGDEIKFSAHAVKRMTERDIVLSNADLNSIKQAFSKAEEKGIRDSLFLLKDVALIVNVPNKTVITAVSGESLKENVFTNIDGAIIL